MTPFHVVRARRTAAAVLVLLTIPSFLVARPVSAAEIFDTAFRPITVGRNPALLAAGDWDGDGTVDVAATLLGEARVVVVMGGTDGAGVRMIETSQRAIGITSLDVDGDGDADLAVTQPDSASMEILANDGSGRFARSGRIRAQPAVFRVVAGDLDGDGHPDLITLDGDSSWVAFHRGSDGGRFEPWVSLPLPFRPFAFDVGDVDGDVTLDLVVVGESADAYCAGWLSVDTEGQPVFRECFRENSGYLAYPIRGVAAGDLDVDGHDDIALIEYGGRVLVIRSLATGGFAAPETYSIPDTEPGSVRMADWTGDGRLDVGVCSSESNQVHLLAGDGHGGLLPARTMSTGRTPVDLAPLGGGETGKVDIVTGCIGFDYLALHTSRGDGGYGGQLDLAGPFELSECASADVDADGHLDIVMASKPFDGAGEIRVYRGRGDGTFYPALDTALGLASDAMTVNDITGDGVADLLLAHRGRRSVSVAVGRGDGTYRRGVEFTNVPYPDVLAAGDINGDGFGDVVSLSARSDSGCVLLGGSGGSLHPGPSFAVSGSPTDALLQRIDSDPYADLIVAGARGSNIMVFRGTAEGTFVPGGTLSTFLGSNRLLLADVTGDCLPDLLVGYLSLGLVSVFPGRGNGAFATPFGLSTGEAVWGMAWADFDGDGKGELAVARPASASLALFSDFNEDDPGHEVSFGVGTYPVGITMADFDADGRMDLALPMEESDRVAVLINRSPAVAPPPTDSALGLRLTAVTPNPSAGRVGLSIEGAAGEPLQLEVFDVAGRRVHHRDVAPVQSDQTCVVWEGGGDDGKPCTSGAYFVRLSTSSAVVTSRVTVIR